jgi:drug/metabolite transporter (DMT)-like permease
MASLCLFYGEKNYIPFMNKKTSFLVYLALTFSMFIWGFTFIWSKQVFEVYNPHNITITVIFARLVISCVFMVLANLFLKQVQPLAKKDLGILVLMSFFQPFLYFIGEYYGLFHSSSTVTAVIISTIPLFAPVAAFIFLRERISYLNVIGIAVSMIGVVMVIFKDSMEFSTTWAGIAFLAMAIATAIAYSIIIVKLTGKYNPYTILTYQNIFGSLFFLPLFFAMDYGIIMEIGILPGAIWPILFLAVLGSSVAYVLFIYGVQSVGITRANSFANVIPAFTGFFAFLLLGETLTFINIVGIGITIVGLFLSQIGTLKLGGKKVVQPPLEDY